ncbi:MAG: hypothetical protein KDA52_15935, partial [Planctomycetaceae bacterium]|nr:hypothetical protein [Planctomycetaceae bacterium]
RIFELCCRQRNIPFDTAAVDYLYANHYDQQRLPRSSDPRDLLDIVQSICRFNENPVVLTNELLADATARFFCDVEDLTTLASAH